MDKVALQLFERIKHMSARDQSSILELLEQPAITERERAFVAEYVARMDAKSAAKAAGFAAPPSDSAVQDAVATALLAVEAKALLTADYVREFMHDVLELCPTDFFMVAPDGDWCVDPAEFSLLPHSVRRLVEGLEVKFVGGRRVFKVSFVSKTAVLAMAARYTLTQKLHAAVAVVPWDAVQGSAAEPDPLEERIAAENSGI